MTIKTAAQLRAALAPPSSVVQELTPVAGSRAGSWGLNGTDERVLYSAIKRLLHHKTDPLEIAGRDIAGKPCAYRLKV